MTQKISDPKQYGRINLPTLPARPLESTAKSRMDMASMTLATIPALYSRCVTRWAFVLVRFKLAPQHIPTQGMAINQAAMQHGFAINPRHA